MGIGTLRRHHAQRQISPSPPELELEEQEPEGVGPKRRYYRSKTRAALDLGETALAGLWQGKRDALTGAALPVKFPSAKVLSKLGLELFEDLDGLNLDALIALEGIAQKSAEAILVALPFELDKRSINKPHLPEGFPARVKLETAGYTTWAALEGYAVGDLARIPGVTADEATAVHAALTAGV